MTDSQSDTDILQRGLQPPAGTAAPFPENGDGHGSDGGLICARCQTANPTGAETCMSCRSFLAANQAARKSGVFAKYQPVDVLMSADEMLAGVLTDQGGADEMTTLRRWAAAKLRDCEIFLTLNRRTVVNEGGAETPAGRKAHDRYLQALDRAIRLVTLLGLERKARRIPTPHEYWHQRQQQQNGADAAVTPVRSDG